MVSMVEYISNPSKREKQLVTKSSDTYQEHRFRLKGKDGYPKDLTGAVVKGYLASDKYIIIEKDMEIENEKEGVVKFHFYEDENIPPGKYDLEFKATYDSGEHFEVFPQSGFVPVVIEEDVFARGNQTIISKSLSILIDRTVQATVDTVNKGNFAKIQGDYAKTQANYALGQGNYAKSEGNTAKTRGNYAKDQGDYAKEQGEFAFESGDVTRLDWSNPVDTFEDLPSNPSQYETRMIRATGKVFRYYNGNWMEVQDIDATAINEVDSRLTSQLNETNSKLAQTDALVGSLETYKANQTDLLVERDRIDNLVAPPAGVDNAETSDIRIGADGVTYDSAGTSVRTQFTKVNKVVDGLTIALRELPNGVKDELTENVDGSFTYIKRVQEYVLKDSDFHSIGNGTNIDFVRILKPSGYEFVSGEVLSISGSLTLEGTEGDKPFVDSVKNIGYISVVSGASYGFVFEKGKYADLNAVKAEWLGKNVLYKLTNPIVRTITPYDKNINIVKLTKTLESLDNIFSNWKGKKGNFLGDSITLGTDGTYITTVKDILGLSVARNYGIGGTALCYRDALHPGQNIDTNYPPVLSRWENMDNDADITFVLIGTNDYSSQVPLGDKTSTLNTEFYGGLNILLDGLRAKYPDRLVIISNLLRRNNANRAIPLTAYNEAIENKCKEKGFIMFDAYNGTGLNFGADYYTKVTTTDGLHPNAKGSSILGQRIAGFINSK